MKSIIFILLVVSPAFVFCQQKTDNTDNSRIDFLIDKINSKTITAEERKELQDMAIAIQNKAQDLEEKQHQTKKALASIDKAIIVFTALTDTLGVANNRKYKGYLAGRLGKFRDAKNETETAIYLYLLKKMSAEVAVAQFDLARMFEFENSADSAIYYANQSRRFWQSKEVNLRVLIINNMLVSLYLKLNQPEKAKFIQQESVLLVSKPAMHWQAVIDFYFTSMLFFRTVNDIGVAGDYQRLYLSKIAELKNQGIIANSYYERDRE